MILLLNFQLNEHLTVHKTIKFHFRTFKCSNLEFF